MTRGGHTTRRAVWRWATTGLLTLAAACGGGSDKDASKTTSPTGAGGGATTSIPGAPGAPGAPSNEGSAGTPTSTTSTPGAGTPSGGGTGEPGAAAGPTTTKPPLPLTASVADDCVRPGGAQTLTVQSNPETPIGFSSRYADGKTAMDAGFYGGTNAGKSDATGTYTSTWTIAPNAPAGEVKVTVYGNRPDYEMAEHVVTFRMSDATGRC